jgi:glycerophosphoryl diester phosphodiesterase
MKYIYPFLLTLISIGCANHMNPSFTPLEKTFDKEGHRGCRGLMPENTIPAYLKAIDLRVTTLEMDAVITKDKQVVMSHEPFFNHEITTKPDGTYVTQAEEKSLNIYHMTYEETRRYDVGTKPNPRFPKQQKIKATKPLLRDVIDSVETYAAKNGKEPLYYNIETKCTAATDNLYHPPPGEFVELLMAIIKEKKIEKRVIIQSFDIRSLQYLHKNYPTIKTSLLIEGFDKRSFALQLKDLGFVPTIYSPEYSLVTPLLVKQCHDMGIKLIPWTVDEKKEIDSLKNLGVDGIITDYPDLFN